MERQNLGEKFTVKGIILLILIIAFMLGLFLALINIGEPKSPATKQQVYTALENQGLSQNDFTDGYVEEYPALGIVSVVGYRTDDFRIEFFELENNKFARNITVQLNQAILDARDITNDSEHITGMQNYYIHTYNVDDKHFWLMRIDNTVIYGFCYDDNYEKMVDVMTELGYRN